MSKRLQVLMDERELREVQRIARRHGMTVADWVRRAIRDARLGQAAGDPGRKLAAVRVAAQCEFPTAGIDAMLAEIERGYTSSAP